MQKIAALDGLRAIAVLLVIAFHARTPITGGWVGVDIFFVISGFLITAILRDEVAAQGKINLLGFYRKRLRRLYPALLTLLLLYLLLAPHIWSDYIWHYRDALLAALYLTDYSPSFGMKPPHIGHTWSLSVEMQFYLIWPALILASQRLSGKSIIMLLIGAYAISSGWRTWQAEYSPWREVYYAFDTRLSGLILGSIVAVGWRENTLPKIKTHACLAAITLVLTAALFCQWRNSTALGLGPLAAEISTAVLIVYALQAPEQLRWLELAPLRYLGQISYGAYLFHYPIIVWLRAEMEWPATLVIGGTATFALAALSYRLIETRFSSRHADRNPRDMDIKAARHPDARNT